jgi:hypothetical protein
MLRPAANHVPEKVPPNKKNVNIERCQDMGSVQQVGRVPPWRHAHGAASPRPIQADGALDADRFDLA